jgi:hypothetical protein
MAATSTALSKSTADSVEDEDSVVVANVADAVLAPGGPVAAKMRPPERALQGALRLYVRRWGSRFALAFRAFVLVPTPPWMFSGNQDGADARARMWVPGSADTGPGTKMTRARK